MSNEQTKIAQEEASATDWSEMTALERAAYLAPLIGKRIRVAMYHWNGIRTIEWHVVTLDRLRLRDEKQPAMVFHGMLMTTVIPFAEVWDVRPIFEISQDSDVEASNT
jgi:hypothetical protein